VYLIIKYIWICSFIFSDITSLPSSSYQSSLPLHSGQHLLNIQGGVLKGCKTLLTLDYFKGNNI